ncbi:MAG: Cysteine desulfurase [Chlamydiales bacterium]|nr:Cysteine desulfurase [Chlamydiales bacterium]
MKTSIDLRADFPILQKKINGYPLIYFDTAASAQKPQCVIDALTDFYAHQYGTVHRAVYTLCQNATDAYNAARVKTQKFIGAAYPEEIVFTRGTTASLNLLAQSFGKRFIRPGHAIVISEIEHHSNIVPWQMLCEQTGAVLRIVPVNDEGELILEAYHDLLDEKVKLVSLAHVSNVLGTVHPVKQLIEAAHQVGAYVCLDGAQAAAHLPLNVQELDVDFYAFSAHKLYGPTGLGVLYGKQDLLEKLPPIEGGGDMIDQVNLETSSYQKAPLKFEAGTPMIAEVVAFGAALDYLSEIGMESIQEWENELLLYATKKLEQIPNLKVIGTAAQKGAIISFIVKGVHPLDLATLLDCRGIAIRTGHHCSQPAMERFELTSAARISFGVYNTFEEIDQFVNALHSILELLT